MRVIGWQLKNLNFIARCGLVVMNYAVEWIVAIPEIKDTMDCWFGEHPKDERALQQLVVWENNDSPWAKGTDYFIVDIEYDSRKGKSKEGGGGRFDLVALKLESDSASRKLIGKTKPKFTIIEMKAGDGALKGKAGLQEHVTVLEKFNNSTNKTEFIKEMIKVFNQKNELGLIKSIPAKKEYLQQGGVDNEIEYMLLLAGHDPASKKLSTKLLSLNTKLPLVICTANFMGFGLYKENIYNIKEFTERFKEQIYCCQK